MLDYISAMEFSSKPMYEHAHFSSRKFHSITNIAQVSVLSLCGVLFLKSSHQIAPLSGLMLQKNRCIFYI